MTWFHLLKPLFDLFDINQFKYPLLTILTILETHCTLDSQIHQTKSFEMISIHHQSIYEEIEIHEIGLDHSKHMLSLVGSNFRFIVFDWFAISRVGNYD
jgi:hypothetical protein